MMFGNVNVTNNGLGFRRCSQTTPVPNSRLAIQRNFSSLEVPNGEVVPMGCENGLDFLPYVNPDIHQCPDGTLISKSTGKIIRDNTKLATFPERNRSRQLGRKTPEWNDSASMTDNGNLTMDDIRYAKMSEVENRKLRDGMTTEQKRMLSDLEGGKIFRLSKLED